MQQAQSLVRFTSATLTDRTAGDAMILEIFQLLAVEGVDVAALNPMFVLHRH